MARLHRFSIFCNGSKPLVLSGSYIIVNRHSIFPTHTAPCQRPGMAIALANRILNALKATNLATATFYLQYRVP